MDHYGHHVDKILILIFWEPNFTSEDFFFAIFQPWVSITKSYKIICIAFNRSSNQLFCQAVRLCVEEVPF
jgi:hypothetical protein